MLAKSLKPERKRRREIKFYKIDSSTEVFCPHSERPTPNFAAATAAAGSGFGRTPATRLPTRRSSAPGASAPDVACRFAVAPEIASPVSGATSTCARCAPR